MECFSIAPVIEFLLFEGEVRIAIAYRLTDDDMVKEADLEQKSGIPEPVGEADIGVRGVWITRMDDCGRGRIRKRNDR